MLEMRQEALHPQGVSSEETAGLYFASHMNTAMTAGQHRVMSTSLRDQLLKAGLISKKQANEAERQLQRQERPPQGKHKPGKHLPGKQHTPAQAAGPARAPHVAQSAKTARDLELNRRQQEKAEKKARQAQIKQLIEQNRLPAAEGDEAYNFLDGNKIRRIPVNASIRERLGRGEVVIVRHAGNYDLVPAAIATRIRERDEHAVVAPAAVKEDIPADDAYKEFSVPDDLIW
jgi:uncharacterized protein YaiL (DUF2058 family)